MPVVDKDPANAVHLTHVKRDIVEGTLVTFSSGILLHVSYRGYGSMCH